MKKIILILSAVLFIIIIILSIISRTIFNKNASIKNKVKNNSSAKNGSSTYATPKSIYPAFTPEQEQVRLEQIRNDYSASASAAQLSSLKQFQKLLPYESPDFDINYSKVLGRFIITRKKVASYTKVRSYLSKYGVLSVYDQGSGLFIETDDPFDIAVKKILSTIREGNEK